MLEKALFLAREFDESQVDLVWRSLAKSKYMEHCEKAKERKITYDRLEETLKNPGFVPLNEEDARVLREKESAMRKKKTNGSKRRMRFAAHFHWRYIESRWSVRVGIRTSGPR